MQTILLSSAAPPEEQSLRSSNTTFCSNVYGSLWYSEHFGTPGRDGRCASIAVQSQALQHSQTTTAGGSPAGDNKYWRGKVIKNPWLFPFVLADKKDVSVRVCVDYKRLNAITTRDSYPFLSIEEVMYALGSPKVFATLDCSTGFLQISNRKGYRENSLHLYQRAV